MKKIKPDYFQGTEYVQLSKLPLDQAIQLSHWLKENEIFSSGGHTDCVHFEDYEFWFENCRDAVEMMDHSPF